MDRRGDARDGGVRRVPPTSLVRRIVETLSRAGLPTAIGGSALLVSEGADTFVNDWDVTVDGPPSVVEALLTRQGFDVRDETTNQPPFAGGQKLVVDGGDHHVDVLVNFALIDGDAVFLVTSEPRRRWRDLPMADPEIWARAYELLGRPERSRALRRAAADRRGSGS